MLMPPRFCPWLNWSRICYEFSPHQPDTPTPNCLGHRLDPVCSSTITGPSPGCDQNVPADTDKRGGA